MVLEEQKPNSKNEDHVIQSNDLRIRAGIFTISLAFISVTIIAVFSKSQSKESILGLMGMSYFIVLLVLFMVIRRPAPEHKGWFHMDNPLVAIPVALFVEVFSFFLNLLAWSMINIIK